MARVVKWLIIPFFAILLMSHNAGALELTKDIVLLQGNYQSTINTLSPSNSCYQYLDSNAGVRNNCSDSPAAISGIRVSIPVRTYNAGDFVTILIYNGINAENNSSDVFFRGLSLTEGGGVFDIVDLDFQSFNGSTGLIKITLRAYTTFTYTNNTHYLSFSNNSALFVLYHNEYIYFGKTTVWGSVGGVDYSNQIQDVIDAIEDSGAIDYTQQFNNINNSINEQNDKENEAVENIENQTTDDVDAGDSSGATNLIGNVQGIITQIANVSASDCGIRADFGHINLGLLNLCTGKENLPAVVNFIAYAFEFLVYFGATIIIVKQILSVLDWARGDA